MQSDSNNSITENPVHSISSIQESFEIQCPENKESVSTTEKYTWKDFVENNFYFSGPWSLSYYCTIRGLENFHIYLWIAKDISWMQDQYECSMIFGILALAWCAFLAYFAIKTRSYEEMYMLLALILWLVGNFTWMAGEVFNGDDDYIVPVSSHILEAAIGWILLYHIILRPLHLLESHDNVDPFYFREGLTPRFSYFRNWREYEHAHTLCWLGKDLSWNQTCAAPWVICLIPTLFLAADFIYVTFMTRNQMEDSIHYLAQLMWVIGNMLWAIGNIFIEDSAGEDDPSFIFEITRQAQANMRWFAAWVLFAAYWPIIIMYCFWIPMTYLGYFDKSKKKLNNNQNSPA